MIIRCVKCGYFFVWELFVDDFLCRVQHQVTTSSLAHPAKDHHVVNIVEFHILTQRVTQVNAHSFINLLGICFFSGILHRLLNFLQALGMDVVLHSAHVSVRIFHLGWNIQTRFACEARDTTLTQVHVRYSSVHSLCPWIGGCFGIHIQSHITELADPPC